MAQPMTEAEIAELPATLTFQQSARLLGWDKNVLAREVRCGRFPVQAIPRGPNFVLPKRGLLDLLAGVYQAPKATPETAVA